MERHQNTGIKRYAVPWLAVLCGLIPGLLLSYIPAASAQTTSITRALLIACEEFVIQDSLAPSARTSVTDMMNVLMRGGDLQNINTEIGTLSTIAQLQDAIDRAFEGSTEDDVCFVYIATHGNYRPDYSDAPAKLTLSNGQVETTFSATSLRELLDPIPGTKILFLDACNSGAFIEKGVDIALNGVNSLRSGDAGEYMVLTSASANEMSWHYSETEVSGYRKRVGTSYFGAALSNGLGKNGQYLADLNGDKQITLKELYRYLLNNQATSTAQVYPQHEDFVLFTYDDADTQTDTPPIIENIIFENETLSFEQPTLSFSFTVRRPVHLQYHITYYRDNNWDFSTTTHIADTFDGMTDDLSSLAALEPGRKQRTIQMPGIQPDTSGYVLFQIMAIEESGPILISSRLINVSPTRGDPNMTIALPVTSFIADPGAELAVYVQHAFPLRLSVAVYDLSDNLIYRIAENQLTRPLRLTPDGSVYYWDGRDQYGQQVPSGMYSLVATTTVGGVSYRTQPMFFQIISPGTNH